MGMELGDMDDEAPLLMGTNDLDPDAIPEGYRPSFGIPYASGKIIRVKGKPAEAKTCPRCGEVIICTERKDFESFSGAEYSEHYAVKHAVDDGRIKIGTRWVEPIPSASR
jgi:hypothetical protein